MLMTNAEFSERNGQDVHARAKPVTVKTAAAHAESCCCDCGTPVPRKQSRCAICERRASADPGEGARVAVNWLIMTAMIGAIFAAGIWFGP